MPSALRLVLPHGLMLLASCLLYGAATLIEADTGGGTRIGPDAWPKAMIVIMGLLCAYEIVKRLALRSRAGAGGLIEGLARNPSGDSVSDASANAVEHHDKLAWGIALVVGYVIAVPWLGFFVTTALFLAVFPWFGGFRRPVLSGVVGLVGSFVLVVMFMRVAYVSLPLGEGPFLALSIRLLALIGVT